MFKRLIYKKPKVNGIHTSCPKCGTVYYDCKEICRKEYKKRLEVYLQCTCGCKYKYHFGI